MNNNEEDRKFFSYLVNMNKTSDERSSSLLIVFEIVRICSSICSVLGVLGNLSLIYIISKTSFRHVSYGLLIVVIALFDSIRLLSSIFYYLLFANLIQINILTETIYVFMDRYSIFVINWCKVRFISFKKKRR